MASTDDSAKRGPKTTDEDNNIVYGGATMTQICEMFRMDSRDVNAKLNGQAKPIGIRRGVPTYAVKDVAPYLVSPPYDIDEFIQRMSIADLPPLLRKEYWAGLRSRQLYEKEAAELWPTSDVVDMVSSLFKTLRMSLLLTREGVERETELSERQRQIITRIIDNALEDAYAATVSKFSKEKSSTGRAEVRDDEDADPEDI